MTDRCALLPTICLVSGDRALRFMDERVPGISVPASHDRTDRTPLDPGEETYQLALEQARHALAIDGVAGAPPDQLPARQRDRAPVRRPRPRRGQRRAGAPRGGVALVSPVSLRERLRSGRPVITSELVPPRGADAEAVREQVATLAFADALNVTDLPQARTRMSALAAAALVLQAGGRPILQMTTRDRNRLALAADAIGAAALGVEAVLPLFGDPVPEGIEASEVRDVDSAGLVALLADLAHGPHAGRARARRPGLVPDRRRSDARTHDAREPREQDRRGSRVRPDADRARRRRLRRLARAVPRRRPVRAGGDPARCRDPALRRHGRADGGLRRAGRRRRGRARRAGRRPRVRMRAAPSACSRSPASPAFI